MKIHDARSLPSVAQEDLRSKVIRALRNGKKQVEVAELFGVTLEINRVRSIFLAFAFMMGTIFALAL